MDIDLNCLLVFRHLAQSGSFTETGKRWNVSQPAVSVMIGRLESAAGLILLERSNAGTKLAADGVLFLEHANEVCEAYLAFIDGMHTIGRRLDRQVLVGIDSSWFGSVLKQKFPTLISPSGVTPIIREISGIWREMLQTTQLDVILASRFLHAGLSSDIQEAVIRKERGITVAWNPAFHSFDEANFSFPEILRNSVLMPDPGVVSNFATSLKVWCEQAYGIQPTNTVEFSSEADAAAAANAGLGVLIAPGDAMPRLGKCGESLTHVRTFEFLLPESFTLGVYCRSDETSRDVLAVAASIVKLGRKLFPQV